MTHHPLTLDIDDQDEPGSCFASIVIGLLFSLPFWAALAVIVWIIGLTLRAW